MKRHLLNESMTIRIWLSMLIIDWHLLAKKWQYHTYCIWYYSSVTWFTQCNLALKLAIIWSKRCFTCICIIYNCAHCSPEHLPLPCPSNSHDGRHLGFWQYLRHWVAKNGKNVFLTSENLGVDTEIITLWGKSAELLSVSCFRKRYWRSENLALCRLSQSKFFTKYWNMGGWNIQKEA